MENDHHLILKDIKEFRKNNKNYVSTTHTCTFSEFMVIAPALKKDYPFFRVEIKKENVKITIDRYFD